MKINGTTYNTPELNFANMTILEGWGLSLDKMRDRPLGFLSGFVALAVGSTPEDSAKVIDEHIKGGGSLDDLTAELNRAIGASGFFKMPEEQNDKV